MLINIEDFRTIFCLELAEKSKSNVLKVVKQFEKREDIISAEPDYSMTFFGVPNPVPTYYSYQ
jgi:hypothetical protein